MRSIQKALFPAAGLGTRFLPATKAMPKEMLPAVDKPLIQYVVEEAYCSGIRDMVVVTGRGKTAIEEHFDFSYELDDYLRRHGKESVAADLHRLLELTTVAYVRQHVAKGLGHAVLQGRTLIGNEPFAVLLADDFILAEPTCLAQLLRVYEQIGETVIALMEVPHESVSSYGVAWGHAASGLNAHGRVLKLDGVVEKPKIEVAPSNLAIIGRYILHPDIFSELQNIRPGSNGEIQLTDGLQNLVSKRGVYGVVFTGQRFDAGSKLGLLEASIELALTREDLQEPLMNYLQALIGRTAQIGRTKRA
jgi:UTP--glucose-1-phosphate uridylyltransferase